MPEQIYQESELFQSWSGFIDFYRAQLDKKGKWRNWLFRGMQNSEWELKSSLERAADRVSDNGNRSVDRVKFEDGLLRRFKRQAHHYLSDVPADEAWMEWQALMQHFGAPTRLLDWTYSFFVAAFFAIENLEPGQTCAVWAFDSMWWYRNAYGCLDDDIRRKLKGDPNTKDPETVKAILRGTPLKTLVFPINSDRLNERLAIQQGAFLAPGNVSFSFLENMVATIKEDKVKDHLLKLRIQLNRDQLEIAIRDLHSMNINRATLFPGLDGFSAHFKNLLFMDEEIAPLGERLKGPG